MEISLIVDVITAVAVVLGLILGLLQLRHYHISREREADLLLLNSFQTRELSEGVWIIQGLPNGLSKRELEDRLGEEISLVYLVMNTWDIIGLFVFNHEISIDMVNDAHGGPIIFSWQRLEKFVTDIRDDLNRERSFEWFQWLAERIMEREKAVPSIPAHLARRNWK